VFWRGNIIDLLHNMLILWALWELIKSLRNTKYALTNVPVGILLSCHLGLDNNEQGSLGDPSHSWSFAFRTLISPNLLVHRPEIISLSLYCNRHWSNSTHPFTTLSDSPSRYFIEARKALLQDYEVSNCHFCRPPLNPSFGARGADAGFMSAVWV